MRGKWRVPRTRKKLLHILRQFLNTQTQTNDNEPRTVPIKFDKKHILNANIARDRACIQNSLPPVCTLNAQMNFPLFECYAIMRQLPYLPLEISLYFCTLTIGFFLVAVKRVNVMTSKLGSYVCVSKEMLVGWRSVYDASNCNGLNYLLLYEYYQKRLHFCYLNKLRIVPVWEKA